ncbi:hypothetical protein ACVCAH_11475 [Micromonospora sp. LZ34]
MTTSNLPAVRTTTTLATAGQQPTPPTAVEAPAPLRLSTALLIVSAIAAFLTGVSMYAGRNEQAALVGGAALVLLFAAAVERHREHRT